MSHDHWNYCFALYCLWFLSFCRVARSQACNTNDNPTCRGVAVFEALCCPYPSVCYWSGRDGSAGCCPAGQVCGVNAGPVSLSGQVTSYLATTVVVTITTSTDQSTPTSESTPTPTSTLIVVPTSTFVAIPSSTDAVVFTTTTLSQIIAIAGQAPGAVPHLVVVIFQAMALCWQYAYG